MRNLTTGRLGALCVLLLLAAAAPAQAQITFANGELYRGEASVLTLSEPADTVLVTYRPNSSLVATEVILTGGNTSVRWEPKQAGIVTLTASSGESKTVSVRYRRAPLGGVMVLILAGAILFGGAAFATRKLLAQR